MQVSPNCISELVISFDNCFKCKEEIGDKRFFYSNKEQTSKICQICYYRLLRQITAEKKEPCPILGCGNIVNKWYTNPLNDKEKVCKICRERLLKIKTAAQNKRCLNCQSVKIVNKWFTDPIDQISKVCRSCSSFNKAQLAKLERGEITVIRKRPLTKADLNEKPKTKKIKKKTQDIAKTVIQQQKSPKSPVFHSSLEFMPFDWCKTDLSFSDPLLLNSSSIHL